MSEFSVSGRGIDGQSRKGWAVTDDAVSAWFLREILPLEAILMHYLRSNWRNASDIPDLRQEVYARVLQGAREQIPDNPKRFLLVSARNLLINLVRREQVVPMETFADLETFGLASEEPAPDYVAMRQEQLRRLEGALAKLPARTREAIELAFFEGLSPTEVAKRMNVARPTASEFIAKGSIILANVLYGMRGEGGGKS